MYKINFTLNQSLDRIFIHHILYDKYFDNSVFSLQRSFEN